MDENWIRREMVVPKVIAYKYFTFPDQIDIDYIAARVNWRIVDIIAENPIATLKVEVTIDD
jgi:hypothetical protein